MPPGGAAGEDRIWRQVAFLARYGHQQVSESLGLTVRDLDKMVTHVAKIVDEEQPQQRG